MVKKSSKSKIDNDGEETIGVKIFTYVFAAAVTGLFVYWVWGGFDKSQTSIDDGISYKSYTACGTDTSKWRLVYSDLIHQVVEDSKDGLWNSEPEFGGWEFELKYIDKFVEEKIADESVAGQISLIRGEVFRNFGKKHKLDKNSEDFILEKLGLYSY